MGGIDIRALCLGALWLAVTPAAARAAEADPSSYEGLLGALPSEPVPGVDLPKVALSRGFLPTAIDLSSMMPPPVQQELSSCVAHAVGYAARGYYAALEHNSTPGDATETPSPAFLHTQIVGWSPDKPRKQVECKSSGSSALIALLYLTDNGSLSNREIPISRICDQDITTMSVAKNEFSIKDAKIIFFPQEATSRFQAADLEKIKQSIANGDPVVIGMRMYYHTEDKTKQIATLMALKDGDVYMGSLGPNYGVMDVGHELTVVGYDDERHALKVENSWGRKWAEGGFGWVDYDAAVADIDEAFVMVTSVIPPKPKPLRGPTQKPNVADERACALVTQADAEGSYEGFVESSGELDELSKKYGAPAVEKVSVRPWPVCETLLTLRTPLEAQSRPLIKTDSGQDHAKFGDLLGFSVTTPNFPSFVYVVYLQADGTVVNLVPRRGVMRKQLAAGTVLRFGDGKDGRQKFRVGAPTGAEAVVAIAARSPLDQLEKLETEPNGQYRLAAGQHGKTGEKDPEDRLYLSLLRMALSDKPDAVQTAREVTADVFHVTVVQN